MIKKLPLLVASLIFLVLHAQPSASGFEQHQWGASYFDWHGYELSRESEFVQSIKPLEISPYMYWSINWGWGTSGGAYTGIQTYPDHGFVLFSLWDATASRPGPGVTCYAFGHEGSGHSCYKSIPQIIPHTRYTIRIFPNENLGDPWWSADLQIGDEAFSRIGDIKAPLLNLSSQYIGNFIEYWGPKTDCDSVRGASAEFGVPRSTITSQNRSVRFSRPELACVNSWAEYPLEWFKDGPIMRFGGKTKEIGDVAVRYLPHQLITKLESGQGKISNSKGEMCSNTCTYLIEHNTPLTLTPIAYPGFYFSRWGGECSHSKTCLLTIDRDKTVLAYFREIPKVRARWFGTQLKLRVSTLHKEDNYFLIGNKKSSKRITSKTSKIHVNEVDRVTIAINGQVVWEGSFNLAFDSCKALRKVFKNGIAKSGTFKASSRNSSTPYPLGYKLNRHLDFNSDGFICN